MNELQVKVGQKKRQGDMRQEQQIRLEQQLSRESILLSLILHNFFLGIINLKALWLSGKYILRRRA